MSYLKVVRIVWVIVTGADERQTYAIFEREPDRVGSGQPPPRRMVQLSNICESYDSLCRRLRFRYGLTPPRPEYFIPTPVEFEAGDAEIIRRVPPES